MDTQVASARTQLTILTTSSVRPSGWVYIAPEGEALTWFSASDSPAPGTSPGPESYVTSLGDISFLYHRGLSHI